jgi:hypothetical protein
MRFGPEFYTRFWDDFRAAYPHLPTRSGWKRRPNDIGQNYVGHRLERYDNLYVHVVFRDRGPTRRLCVELYGSVRADREWTVAVGRLLGVPDLELNEDENVSGLAGRLEHVIERDLNADEAWEARHELIRRAGEVYQLLLDAT